MIEVILWNEEQVCIRRKTSFSSNKQLTWQQCRHLHLDWEVSWYSMGCKAIANFEVPFRVNIFRSLEHSNSPPASETSAERSHLIYSPHQLISSYLLLPAQNRTKEDDIEHKRMSWTFSTMSSTLNIWSSTTDCGSSDVLCRLRRCILAAATGVWSTIICLGWPDEDILSTERQQRVMDIAKPLLCSFLYTSSNSASEYMGWRNLYQSIQFGWGKKTRFSRLTLSSRVPSELLFG